MQLVEGVGFSSGKVRTEYYCNFLNIILLFMLKVIDSWVRLQGFSLFFYVF